MLSYKMIGNKKEMHTNLLSSIDRNIDRCHDNFIFRLFVDVTKANKLIKLLKCIERRILSLKGNITSMIS
ncbi:hypothetical protein V1477_003335, partial [Vespula maculifrons]